MHHTWSLRLLDALPAQSQQPHVCFSPWHWLFEEIRLAILKNVTHSGLKKKKSLYGTVQFVLPNPLFCKASEFLYHCPGSSGFWTWKHAYSHIELAFLETSIFTWMFTEYIIDSSCVERILSKKNWFIILESKLHKETKKLSLI